MRLMSETLLMKSLKKINRAFEPVSTEPQPSSSKNMSTFFDPSFLLSLKESGLLQAELLTSFGLI